MIEIFMKMRNLKKEMMLTLEKNMSGADFC